MTEHILPQIADSLGLAGAWFLSSGIQEPEGGVARYYHSDTGVNARISTEITGYAVSALVYLAAKTSCPDYLGASLKAARFLTREAWDSAASQFPFEYSSSKSDPPQPLAYFFDTGIILRGLLAVWRATGRNEFLHRAAEAGHAMHAGFVRGHVIHPVLNLPDGSPVPHGESWSRNPGCYQLKAALAWRELGEATGDPSFAGYYEHALQIALRQENDFLPGVSGRERVVDRLHAYCYFLEGLLPEAPRQECAEALRRGIAKVARLAREIRPVFERSDVWAQLLRVRLFADALGVLKLDSASAEEEVELLFSFQLQEPEDSMCGGFWFGRKQERMLPFVNPVSTTFALQALQMWREVHDGQFHGNSGELI